MQNNILNIDFNKEKKEKDFEVEYKKFEVISNSIKKAIDFLVSEIQEELTNVKDDNNVRYCSISNTKLKNIKEYSDVLKSTSKLKDIIDYKASELRSLARLDDDSIPW